MKIHVNNFFLSGMEWPLFFRGLIDDEDLVENIHSHNHQFGTAQVIFKLLQEWSKQPGACIEQLEKALEEIGNPALKGEH